MFEQAIILDLETTINAPEPHFGATPTWPGNSAVAYGFQALDGFWTNSRGFNIDAFHDAVQDLDNAVHLDHSPYLLFDLIKALPKAVLVGHNLSFDLMYLLKTSANDSVMERPRLLWDTMKYHHIMTGRGQVNPSLEKVAKFWGLSFRKDDEIKERFKLGIGADKIDQELLYDYLHSDVRATAQIFARQLDHAWGKGDTYLRYALELMTGIKATSVMSMTGMAFNTASAGAESADLEINLKRCEEQVIENWGGFWPCAFNPNSPSQIETLLWGGESKVLYDQEVLDENGAVVLYKSGEKMGQIKTKKATRIVPIDPMALPKSIKLFEKRGWDMKSSAQTLQNLVKHDKATAGAFAADILELRNKAKTITTYFKPYLKFAVNGAIHPAYNHCVTQTGRLSSSKPNMQNVTGKDK